MKIKAIFIVFLLISLHPLKQQLELPEDHFINGWKKFGPQRQFAGSALYNYINGGSEIFLEFGFEELVLQKYRKGEDELSIEVYRMKSPEAALGIYLMKCGKETPISEVSARNTGDRYQIMTVKGNYFILTNNYTAKESYLTVMVELANTGIKGIAEKKTADLFSILPKEHLIEGSEFLIRGPYSLQSIFTFGKGDILLLKKKIFGVAGDYQDEKGETYTRIIIKYPDKAYAQQAYKHLLSNLDSYIKILNQDNNDFSFKDYQEKIGIVTLEKNTLHIKLNLTVQ